MRSLTQPEMLLQSLRNLKKFSEQQWLSACAYLRGANKRLGKRGWLSASAILLGAILLGYAGTEYFELYRGQKELARRWEQQQQQPQAAAPSSTPVVQDDGLTRITSAKIDLDAIVVEGISHRQLNLGPGHLPDTPQPGEAGNSVISAHRDMFFRHISELSKGDEIDVRRNGHVLKFAVTGKKIVMPDDVSVLRPTSEPTLTLITCYPIYYIGPAPKRLIVTATLVGKDNLSAAAANSAGGSQ